MTGLGFSTRCCEALQTRVYIEKLTEAHSTFEQREGPSRELGVRPEPRDAVAVHTTFPLP